MAARVLIVTISFLKDGILAQVILGQLILIQRMRPSMNICGLNGGVLWVARCLFMAAICEWRWMRGFWQETLSLFLDVKSLLGIMAEALFGKNLCYCAVVHLLKMVCLKLCLSWMVIGMFSFSIKQQIWYVEARKCSKSEFQANLHIHECLQEETQLNIALFLHCVIYSITGDIPLAPFLL